MNWQGWALVIGFPVLLATGLGLLCYTAYEYGRTMREQREKSQSSENAPT